MSHLFLRVLACLVLAVLVLPVPLQVQAATLAERLAGRIVLQVESHGEAWYIDPNSHQRYYLGRAEDAYTLMRRKGLGIRHTELMRYAAHTFPARLSGRIVLDVEAHGEAYYIIPGTLRGVFLGTASDAYALMRRYGLGITNRNLAQIPLALEQIAIPTSPTTPLPITPARPVNSSLAALEQDAFARINTYRASKGLNALTWNETIANISREHSRNMANNRVAFGHDGFNERAQTLGQALSIHGVAENVAYNDYPNPSLTAVEGWIESEGHRRNIENGAYTQSAIGVAQSNDGAYYFTQLFTVP